MQYERAREDPKQPSLWFAIDLIASTGDDFAVVVSYGMKDPLGEYAIVQRLKPIFIGKYEDAMQVLFAKIQNRERVGYVAIEPKQDE